EKAGCFGIVLEKIPAKLADKVAKMVNIPIIGIGDKLSDDKKTPIEAALKELKKAHESKDLSAIDAVLEKINEAWKNASEEMYKAQAEAGKDAEGATPPNNPDTKDDAKDGDNVQDVDFEEVKD
ncbi:3-methyl-2-oxobutanoate hydroxymethyltransferase, partial [Flavobacteriaceae bacterium]|nr:3-methyl-2-oxobutanoate hydroxymethyltransferase [Flavobacteriaceae bacterium]